VCPAVQLPHDKRVGLSQKQRLQFLQVAFAPCRESHNCVLVVTVEADVYRCLRLLHQAFECWSRSLQMLACLLCGQNACVGFQSSWANS
jgi:hypothetical protein